MSATGVLYRQFLHPEIVWRLFVKKERVIAGIDAYMQVIIDAYRDTTIQFSCVDIQTSRDENRIVTHLINDLGVRSLDMFDFKDGMIYREYEFILE